MDTIEADVIAIIAKRLPADKRDLQKPIQPSDRLEDIGMDSLGAVEMVFDLEEKFDIEIPYNANTPRTEFDKVSDVVASIKKLIDGQSK